MKHDWDIEKTYEYYYEVYNSIEKYVIYKCKLCNCLGIKSNATGEIITYWIEYNGLSCNEIIIKNIIE